MFLNEYEIEEAVDIAARGAPQFLPYVRFLNDWKNTVNSNSDGWPYWKAGTSCAKGLMTNVKQLTDALRGRGEMPTEAAFKKSLAPIKSAATRFKLPALELGEAPDETSEPSGMRF